MTTKINTELYNEWVELVADYKKGELSRREWLLKHNKTVDQLKYWLKKLSVEAKVNSSTTTEFNEIIAKSSMVDDPKLMIRINDIEIEVSKSCFDASLLRQVIDVISNSSC